MTESKLPPEVLHQENDIAVSRDTMLNLSRDASSAVVKARRAMEKKKTSRAVLNLQEATERSGVLVNELRGRFKVVA